MFLALILHIVGKLLRVGIKPCSSLCFPRNLEDISGLKINVVSASRSEHSAGRCLVNAVLYDAGADITLLPTVWSTHQHQWPQQQHWNLFKLQALLRLPQSYWVKILRWFTFSLTLEMPWPERPSSQHVKYCWHQDGFHHDSGNLLKTRKAEKVDVSFPHPIYSAPV